tara:strand:- start:14872 stop:15696 length:825 start_codon:yes stop_codon:yes gene_type:complete
MPGKQYTHISEYDIKAITFGPVEYAGKNKDKVKVDMFRDGSSSAKTNRFNRFNLCRDANEPMITKYSLDVVREDSVNPDRRGLMIHVSDPITRAALEAIDEMVIKKAVECSKDWFGKAGKPLAQPISEAVVRDRYQPLIFLKDEGDADKVCKIKVKTGGDYPTTMHLNEDGRFRKYGAKAEHLTRGAGVVPVVSMSYGVWIIPGGKFGLSMQAEEMMVTPGEGDADDLSHFASSKPIEVHSTSPLVDGASIHPQASGVEDLPVEAADDEEYGPM